MISSSTAHEYDTRLTAFRAFSRDYPDAVTYAMKTWIEPYGPKIVAFWVNQVAHFGHSTTSMAESSHSSLKAYLVFGSGDLATVFRKLQLFWSAQVSELSLERQKRQKKVAFRLQNQLFEEIKSKVVTQAAQIIEQELRALPQRPSAAAPLPPLTPAQEICGDACNRMNIALGLPCRHRLLPHLRDSRPLEIAEIDVHWWWHRPADFHAGAGAEDHDAQDSDPPSPPPPPASPETREPAIIRGKGRPRGSVAVQKTTKGKNRGARSTRRIPSAFENTENDEIAEAAAAPPSTAPGRLTSIPGRPVSSTRGRPGRRRLHRTPTPTPSPSPSPVHGGDDDLYEPGTTAPRRSARFLTALEDGEDDDLAGDEVGDGLISAHLEGRLDRRIEQDQQDELTLQEDSQIFSCIHVAI